MAGQFESSDSRRFSQCIANRKKIDENHTGGQTLAGEVGRANTNVHNVHLKQEAAVFVGKTAAFLKRRRILSEKRIPELHPGGFVKRTWVTI